MALVAHPIPFETDEPCGSRNCPISSQRSVPSTPLQDFGVETESRKIHLTFRKTPLPENLLKIRELLSCSRLSSRERLDLKSFAWRLPVRSSFRLRSSALTWTLSTLVYYFRSNLRESRSLSVTVISEKSSQPFILRVFIVELSFFTYVFLSVSI